ncbi:MAG: DUF2314 domain-containing protein [Tannerellaceae bacterium]|nr:DUF2314 domain-containing protein [Tannerellaceae bacterium]
MARRSVSDRALVEEGECLFLAQTQQNGPVITTWINWEEVIDSYPENTLGGRKDRDNDDHNGKTGIVYLYLSQEDYENKKYSPVTVIPEEDYENLLIMYSSDETARMSALARERISYLKKGLQLEESSSIVKMAIPVDEELREEAGTDWEHIWFEVQSVDDDTITAKLLQEPYYFKHIQTGNTVTLPVSDLTDWLLYIGQTTIDPDRAYLLAGL